MSLKQGGWAYNSKAPGYMASRAEREAGKNPKGASWEGTMRAEVGLGLRGKGKATGSLCNRVRQSSFISPAFILKF